LGKYGTMGVTEPYSLSWTPDISGVIPSTDQDDLASHESPGFIPAGEKGTRIHLQARITIHLSREE
jgi:Na+-transporting NADH:ubiquinone oxidoreductase subunit NqrA